MESLNAQLQPFLEWLLRTTVQASILICVILLLQRILRNRLGIRWHYGLWLLLLVRMSLPWAPQSRASLFNLIPLSAHQQQTEYGQQENGEQKVGSDVAGSESVESVPASPATTTQESPDVVAVTPSINQAVQNQLKPDFTRIVKILPLLWLIGAMVLGVYVCACNFRLWWLVTRERPLTDQKILDLLEDCKAEMGIRNILGIVTTDKVKSAALFGFIRPRLLLPHGMIETLSQQELRYVLLHELAHLKRHDIYAGWLMSLLQILHWFNPLVWLAFYRMRSDRELACDALVLARTQSEEPKSYGRIIVNLVERFSRPQRLPGMAGILETKAQLKRRVTMIAKFKKNSYQWSPLSVILIIILACISVPDAISTKASQTSTMESAPKISLRRVWSGPDVDLGGAPSPDGRYLSYVDWDTGDLAIYEFATAKKRRLTNEGSWDEPIEFALFSRWSPDGKQIVYDWYNDEKEFADLRVIGLNVSKPRILYSNKEAVWLQTYDWSPDGKQILACFNRKDETIQIVLVSAADGSVRVLKTLDDYYPKNMCFSPDGRYIAYDFPPEAYFPERDISLLSIDGGGLIPLIEHPADDIVLGWAPDGKNIFFASDRTGDFDVWAIQVAGGKPQGTPEMVKPSMGPIKPLGFTRKGSFYYGISQDRKDIYIAELDPQTGEILAPPKRTITRFEGANQTPDYSPDGKYLAYISTRGVRSSFMRNDVGNVLCVRSLETGKDRKIFPEGLKSFGYPRWSPDSRSVFVVSWVTHKDSVGIYRIDAQTGGVTRVVISEVGELYWHERSRDGKAIFLVRRDRTKNLRQIVARDIKTGMETEIYRSPSSESFYVFSSPDGKRLSLISRDQEGGRRILKVLPAIGGEPRELHKWEEDDVVSLYHTWSADGRYIFFTKRSNEKTEEEWKWSLWRIPVDGGEAQKLGLEMLEISSLSVHPDGRHIAFQSSGQKSKFAEVWVMENFLQEAPVAKPEPTTTLRRVEVRGRGRVHSRPSLDGKYMSDVDFDTGNLMVRDIATGKERMLKKTDPNWFAYESLISPENKRVAFLQFNPKKEDFDLQVIGFDGTDIRTLLGAEEIAGYFNLDAWSPDGRYIFGRLERKPMQLVRVSADDGSVQIIKKFEQGKPSSVQVSPDGRYLAYSHAEQKNSKPDIFIFDLEQNQETTLVTHAAANKLLGWTPDGQHIFFTSDRNGTWDGWLLRVVDGKPAGLPEMIKAGMGDVTPIGFTQAGAFYYAYNHEAWNIYTAELDRNTRQVTSEPVPVRLVGKDFCPDFSPDGQYLAYLAQSDRTKPQVILIRTLATGQEREIKPDLPRFERLRWCPDSRHLLISFFRSMDSPSIIYKLDIQTGEYTPLAQIEGRHLRQAELFADGKTLIYRKLGLGTVTPLIIRDIETGSEKELQFAGTSFAFWSLSPDGKEVAYSIREGGAGSTFVLKIVSIETGESRTLVEDAGFFPVWSSDGRDVLFTRNVNELWRVSAEGGEPHKLFEWKEMIMAPRIHPDGQRIAFHSGGYVSEMWVMENFLPTTVAAARK